MSINEEMIQVSIIIVAYNVKNYLELTLSSVVQALEGICGEIIVIDNHSNDNSVNMIREKFPTVMIIENKENSGYSKANNQGVQLAKGKYLLFLNPDTVLPEDFFSLTIQHLDSFTNHGGLGPRIIDGNGRFAQESKRGFPTPSVALFKIAPIYKIFPHIHFFNKYYMSSTPEMSIANVDVLSGSCLMLRSSLINELGTVFDEDYFMYCEDIDLSRRIILAGYLNVYFPMTSIVHFKGKSTKQNSQEYINSFWGSTITFVRKMKFKAYPILIAVLQIIIFSKLFSIKIKSWLNKTFDHIDQSSTSQNSSKYNPSQINLLREKLSYRQIIHQIDQANQ